MTTGLKTLYDTDFNLWLEAQVQLLRDRNLEALDIENLIEEIESLGKSDKRQLRRRLQLLLHHLLKWQYQPSMRTGSWKGTIGEQRKRIQYLLADSPSLKPYLASIFTDCYADACHQAHLETGLPIDRFPAFCPYAIEDALAQDYWPGESLA